MAFSAELAEIRFGCGLSPVVARPADGQALLEGLRGADDMARAFPIEPFPVFLGRMQQAAEIRTRMRKTRGTPEFKEHKKERNRLNRVAKEDMAGWFLQSVLRWIYSPTAFRERLAVFWADHFSAYGKLGVVRRGGAPYVEDAIRPHMAGRFEDLLISAVTSPVMLHFLDQMQSVGPQSEAGRKSKGKRGLNENLAREVMELHTLGVDGRYTQDDVRQLAELFTGMTYRAKQGFFYDPRMAEPGAETVLGHTYSDEASMVPIRAALRDLARHPDTAQHIAHKLAVHFVADDPDPALVGHVATRYRDTDGDLMAVYAALLEHPASWDPVLHNVKPPYDFIASSCRALAVDKGEMQHMNKAKNAGVMTLPLLMMGQVWQRPPGPDGWPEEDAAWITPQGLSTRLRWAMTAPAVLRRDLPRPEKFVETTLGSHATEAVRFAARAAETRTDAIGLILASPSFQRR